MSEWVWRRIILADTIRIHMMGSFWLEANGAVYDSLIGKSRRGVSLMQYLILERGRVISPQRLIRELWSGRRSESPENALKTMVSRVRSLLNGISDGLGNCISSQTGGYCWNSPENVSVDTLDIITIFDQLRHCEDLVLQGKLTTKLQELYIGDLYQTGDLSNGVAQVSWLHREYLDAVLKYIEQLKRAEAYNEICEVCRRALIIDDLDEQLHIELMQAMVNLNRTSEAMAEYRKVVKTQRSVLDAEPSEELEAYYKELAETGKTLKFNLDVIRNELGQQDADRRGPFFCDYRAFKEIYNIQMRNIERLGSTMFLGVIMLGEPGHQLSPVSRESGMAGLQEILKNNLRKGDIVTRFSENIFAMLLPTVNYETGSMVIERIESLFVKEYPSGNIAFHARISPLGGNH